MFKLKFKTQCFLTQSVIWQNQNVLDFLNRRSIKVRENERVNGAAGSLGQRNIKFQSQLES